MKTRHSRVLLCFLASTLFAVATAQVSVTTSKNDSARTGQNIEETILTPDNVHVRSFGRLFSHAVDGYVYGQPLYMPSLRINGSVHNVVFVVTEHDSVYAFDADSNKGINAGPLWHVSFIDPAEGITTVPDDDVACMDIQPEIGITSTPVIDPDTNTIFVVAKTKENGEYQQRLHALDILTGAEQPGSPVTISASVWGTGEGSQNGVIRFNALRQLQRAGLLLVNGNVVVAWGAHCDTEPYHGWVISYDETTLQQTGVWNSTPNGGMGGIWQSGTGLSSDSTSIFFATGNGTFDGRAARDYGSSVVKLSAPGSLPLQEHSFFTPYNQQQLADGDVDLGSGGVLLLPDQGVGVPHRYLAVQVGKQGSIYLLDRTHMGHYDSGENHVVQDLEDAIGGMWATPSWWNNNVYFGGIDDYLRQYTFDTTTGLLSPVAASQSQTYFGYPGPTVSISANGDSDAIAWVLQTDDNSMTDGATLHAYDATNLATEFYNSAINNSRDNPGGAVKFSVPTIANGKVYVPGAQKLSVFGLLGDQ